MTHDERQEVREILQDVIKPLVDRVDNHNETLYGNGKEGLKVDVDRLKTKIIQQEKSQAIKLSLWLLAAAAGLGNIVPLVIDWINKLNP